MKANDIRSMAKSLRNGECTLGFEELQKFLIEAFEYVNENRDGWKERFVSQVEDALDEIQDAVEELSPKKPEIDPEAGFVPETEVVQEAEPETVAPKAIPDGEPDLEIKRYGWKTVYRKMVEVGKDDPVLEAVRWFAVVYGQDTYGTITCVSGMLRRRGYVVEGPNEDLTVSKDGRKVARVKSEGRIVSEFEVAA